MTDLPKSGVPQPLDTSKGLIYAVFAYLIWALLPLFLKAVDHVPAYEVVAHRILWSLPVALITLVWLNRTADIKAALKSPKMLLMGFITAVLISLNWGIFVWAIMVDRATEAALGYYINPLCNIALAAIVLREKLSTIQVIAVILAVCAVALVAWEEGGLPWVSIFLPITFSAYGILRRTLPIGPSQGFFLEILILSLPAVGYIVWLQVNGTGHFTPDQPMDLFLLLMCGPMTAVPLLLFGFATRMLRYSTLGILQYITPTSILILALFVFDEPFSRNKAFAFSLIWLALILYSLPLFFTSKSKSQIGDSRET